MTAVTDRAAVVRILQTTVDAGVKLRVRDGRLKVANRHLMTPELHQDIKDHLDQIIAALEIARQSLQDEAAFVNQALVVFEAVELAPEEIAALGLPGEERT